MTVMDNLTLQHVLVSIEAILAEQVAFTKQAFEKQIEQLTFFHQSQSLTAKEVMTVREAALYLDLSEDHLYRLTSQRRIHFFKPEGKKLYFRKADLDDFMLRNPQRTTDAIGKDAVLRMQPKGGKTW